MAAFEAAYEKHLAPMLTRHGLVAFSEGGRATVDSVFVRVFAFKTSAEVSKVRRAVRSDPALAEVARISGTVLGTPDVRSLRPDFRIFRSPSGPGKQVAAVPGKRVTGARADHAPPQVQPVVW